MHPSLRKSSQFPLLLLPFFLTNVSNLRTRVFDKIDIFSIITLKVILVCFFLFLSSVIAYKLKGFCLS
uniref:Uncharacterized protein n=1 Tax=Lutzomyia longipalpis TaxID=7200 RepID=A0A7G3B776_LUTLO